MLRAIAPCLLVLAVFLSGCTGTEPAVQGTGSVEVTSSPPGAEIYFDHEYRGTTPATIAQAPAGDHVLEVRAAGYGRSIQPVTVITGGTVKTDVMLAKVPATLPVTVRTTATPAGTPGVPRIHVNGYWTYPPAAGTANPAPLLLHTEAFNIGTTGAREVIVHAVFSYEGREVCWDEVYLGTLNAGGHVVTDTMVSCLLPSGFSGPDLVVRFGNVEVTP